METEQPTRTRRPCSPSGARPAGGPPRIDPNSPAERVLRHSLPPLQAGARDHAAPDQQKSRPFSPSLSHPRPVPSSAVPTIGSDIAGYLNMPPAAPGFSFGCFVESRAGPSGGCLKPGASLGRSQKYMCLYTCLFLQCWVGAQSSLLGNCSPTELYYSLWFVETISLCSTG